MIRTNVTNVSRTEVSASDDTTILAASVRLGFIIHNETGQILYVKFGGDATATSLTFPLSDGQIYESPADLVYCGIITAKMAGGTTGYVNVTEFVN